MAILLIGFGWDVQQNLADRQGVPRQGVPGMEHHLSLEDLGQAGELNLDIFEKSSPQPVQLVRSESFPPPRRLLELEEKKLDEDPLPEECIEFPRFSVLHKGFMTRYYSHFVTIARPDVFLSHEVLDLVTEFAMELVETGDLIEAQDKHGKWYLAEVMDLSVGQFSREFKIHYQGWDARWDEWIPLEVNMKNKARLAVVRTHTDGRQFGWGDWSKVAHIDEDE
eukprot:TRINITY_DN1559_c0_g1_i1.p1 TRINITY_DN1559_c0_g1~~TRINITY_DN1559_c0_g1_i1.p1  ORF type:complete len:223 (-),score=56.27 TRINITY_DN1559_c0_g1_i1:317-985(-)